MTERPYAAYRCKTDGALVFEEDFHKHAGHRLVIASDGTFFEWVKFKVYQVTNRMQRRKHYQA